MLPNKVDVINSEWMGWYNHFRQRLQERYNIDISFKDYVLLCRAPYVTVRKQSRHVSRVWIKFNERWILAVRETHRSRILRTALPKTNEELPGDIEFIYRTQAIK